MGDRTSDEPAKVDTVAPQPEADVDTAWTINYGAMGTSVGKPLASRTPNSALYVNDLVVAPDGKPGALGPAPHHFRGVALAPTGPSQVGSMPHPKDRGGRVSAAIAFGRRPQFEFSVSSSSRQDLAQVRRDHAAMVRELAGQLDEFVEPAEAQAALDRVLAAHAADPSTRGTVKRIDAAQTPTVNTTDLLYGPVKGARTFHLRVDAPSLVKDKSVSYSTTQNGETTTGQETVTGTGREDESTTTTSVESERTSLIENTLSTGIRNVIDEFFNFGQTSESVSVTERENGTAGTNGSKFEGRIKGSMELAPDIPVVGWLVKKLIGGKLEVDMSPTTESLFSFSKKQVDTTSGKGGSAWEMQDQKVTEADARTIAKRMMSTVLKSQVAMAVRVKRTTNDSARDSGATKDAHAYSTSTTVGSVQIVGSALQPVLTEE